MIILIVAVLTVSALLLKHAGVNWLGIQYVPSTTILLVAGFILIASLLWRMQRDRTTAYDALDMLMDSGRASLDKHITAIMALLAIWWIVTQTLAGKDVSERMIDVLMIFVIYRGAKHAVDVFANRPTSPPANQDIQQQVVVTPAPEVPPPREIGAPRKTAMSPKKTATGKNIHKE